MARDGADLWGQYLSHAHILSLLDILRPLLLAAAEGEFVAETDKLRARCLRRMVVMQSRAYDSALLTRTLKKTAKRGSMR